MDRKDACILPIINIQRSFRKLLDTNSRKSVSESFLKIHYLGAKTIVMSKGEGKWFYVYTPPPPTLLNLSKLETKLISRSLYLLISTVEFRQPTFTCCVQYISSDVVLHSRGFKVSGGDVINSWLVSNVDFTEISWMTGFVVPVCFDSLVDSLSKHFFGITVITSWHAYFFRNKK